MDRLVSKFMPPLLFLAFFVLAPLPALSQLICNLDCPRGNCPTAPCRCLNNGRCMVGPPEGGCVLKPEEACLPVGDGNKKGNRSRRGSIGGRGCQDSGSMSACQCDPGNPVNMSSGNLHHSRVDMRIGGYGVDLLFERFYNSLNDKVLREREDRGLGVGWTHTYSSKIRLLGAAPGSFTVVHVAVVERADGAAYNFVWRPGARPTLPEQRTLPLGVCDGFADGFWPDTFCYVRDVPCPDDTDPSCTVSVGGTTDWRAQLAWYDPTDENIPQSAAACEFALTTISGELHCYQRDPAEIDTARIVSVAFSAGPVIRIIRNSSNFEQIDEVLLELGNAARPAAGTVTAPVSLVFSYDPVQGSLDSVCPAVDGIAETDKCVFYDVRLHAPGVTPAFTLKSVTYPNGESLTYLNAFQSDPFDPNVLTITDGESRTILDVRYAFVFPSGIVLSETTASSKLTFAAPLPGGLPSGSLTRFDSDDNSVVATLQINNQGGYDSADPECGCSSGSVIDYTTTPGVGELRPESITDFEGNQTNFTWESAQNFVGFAYEQLVVAKTEEGGVRTTFREWNNTPLLQPFSEPQIPLFSAAGLPERGPMVGAIRLETERIPFRSTRRLSYFRLRGTNSISDPPTGLVKAETLAGTTNVLDSNGRISSVAETYITNRSYSDTGTLSEEILFDSTGAFARRMQISRFGDAACGLGQSSLDLHRICKVTRVSPSGNLVTTFADYDIYGTPRSVTEPNSQKTTLITDKSGKATDVVFPDGSTQVTVYDTGGLVAHTQRRSGRFEVNRYDNFGRLTVRILTADDPSQVAMPTGQRFLFGYDSSGRMIGETHIREDGTTAFQRDRRFDVRGLLRIEIQSGPPDGEIERTYDANGNLATEWRPLAFSSTSGRLKVFTYDSLQRLASIKTCGFEARTAVQCSFVAGETLYEHDALSDTISKVTVKRDANPALAPIITEYAWDSFGRLSSIKSPDSGTTTFVYNAAGDLIVRDAPEHRDVFTYDLLGRALSHTATSTDSGQSEGFTFDYDLTPNGTGRLGRVTGPHTVRVLDYDEMGALSNETITITTPEGVSSTYAMTYGEESGLLTDVDLPSGQHLVWVHDQATDRPTRLGVGINGALTVLSSIEYEPSGAVRGYISGNGLRTTLSRDLSGRPTQISAAAPTRSPLFRQILNYYPDGRVFRLETPFAREDSFTYDVFGALDSWEVLTPTEPPKRRFLDFDGAGNRESFELRTFVELGFFETERLFTYETEVDSNRLTKITDPVAGEITVGCVLAAGDRPGGGPGPESGPTAEEKRDHRCRVLSLLMSNCQKHALKGRGVEGWSDPCGRFHLEFARICEVECPPGQELVFGTLPDGVSPATVQAEFNGIIGLGNQLVDNIEDQLDAAAAGDTELLGQLQVEQARLVSEFNATMSVFISKYRIDARRLATVVFDDPRVVQILPSLFEEQALLDDLEQATRDDIDVVREILAVARAIDAPLLLFGLGFADTSPVRDLTGPIQTSGGLIEDEFDSVFTYDDEGRVVSEEILKRAIGAPAGSEVQVRLECFEYSPSGRLAALREAAFSTGGRDCNVAPFKLAEYLYDDLGRRVFSRQFQSQATTRLYIYDRDNRLVAETNPVGAVVREYAYLGLAPVALLQSTEPGAGCAAVNAGAQPFVGVLFILIVFRRRRRNGQKPRQQSALKRVVFGIGWLGLGLGLIGANCDPDGQGPLTPSAFPRVSYIHTDHRGAPMMVTDESQRVIWRATYTPFGEIDIESGAEIILNLRYPGQYENSGERIGSGRKMYYNWHRYYDPEHGRYLTPDPINLVPAGLEQPVYAYALNDPLLHTDRNGAFVGPEDAVAGLFFLGALFCAAASDACAKALEELFAGPTSSPDNVIPFPGPPKRNNCEDDEDDDVCILVRALTDLTTGRLHCEYECQTGLLGLVETVRVKPRIAFCIQSGTRREIKAQ